MAAEQKTNNEQMKLIDLDILLELIAENKASKRELKEIKKKDEYESKEAEFDADKLIKLLLDGNNLKRDTQIKMDGEEIMNLCLESQKLFLGEASLLE
eukprot:809466_1